jgi:hypothetical protein
MLFLNMACLTVALAWTRVPDFETQSRQVGQQAPSAVAGWVHRVVGQDFLLESKQRDLHISSSAITSRTIIFSQWEFLMIRV